MIWQKKRRVLPAVIIYLILLYLFLCRATIGYSKPLGEPPRTPRKIIAVLPVDFPPNAFRDKETKQPAGLDIDVLNAVAEVVNLQIEYTYASSWSLLEEAVLSGKADLATNLTMNEKRLTRMIFTLPTDKVKISLIARASDTSRNRIEAGMKIGVMEGGFVKNMLANRTDITLHTYAGLSELLVELLSNRIDLAITSASNMLKLAYDAKIANRIRVIEPSFSETSRAMALRPGNEALRDRLNKGINEFVGTQEYQNLYQKWWGKPMPFWNTQRVVLAMVGVISMLLTIFMIWRSRERKRAEESLRKSEERYRSLFETANVGKSVTLLTGELSVNLAFCKMLGYTMDELQDKTWQELTPAEEIAPINELLSPLLHGGQDTVRFEKRYIHKNGSHIWADVSSAIQRNSFGEPLYFITTLVDITQRKQVEKEKLQLIASLQQAQKMESIGTLAGGIAHEINNPINGIMNYAQLILDKIGTDNPAAAFGKEIIYETKRISKIVRDLLAFAREENEAQSLAEIKDIIEDTISLIRTLFKKDQISMKIDVPEGLPKVKCRSQQIQQVVMNLFVNSRDALNEKYDQFDEDKEIRVASFLFEKDGRKWLRTSVVDSGAGIEAETLEKIFDPFFTTKPRDIGTGLGLSISYGIIKDHQGELSVESETGKETKFHMDLPIDNDWDLERNSKS